MISYIAGFATCMALAIYKPELFAAAKALAIKGIERAKALTSRTPTPPAQ